jgi:hypothetical protein
MKITQIMFLLLICSKIIPTIKKIAVAHFSGESLGAFRCEVCLRAPRLMQVASARF